MQCLLLHLKTQEKQLHKPDLENLVIGKGFWSYCVGSNSLS